MSEQPFNAGDAGQVRKRARKADLQRQREMDDLSFTLADPRGRRLLWRILARAGVHRSTFNINSLVMAHNEGGRNLGLWLESEIEAANPGAFLEMLREASVPDQVEIKESNTQEEDNG